MLVTSHQCQEAGPPPGPSSRLTLAPVVGGEQGDVRAEVLDVRGEARILRTEVEAMLARRAIRRPS
jgi:hypothetical protein